ncbi:MAG: tRNA (N6-threonylcarbamoyladenosine(37)-N6)-methyltransferase TrmO [Lachnospiraceae bacterium]|nr:tRNA (N6-threonylcarbamoyladenosine(37)-N6)-methyltransferase TrmO [Lachnospiraceae bacterium]
MTMELRQIATIYNDYTDKFGIPRQSGLADTESRIVFEKPYRNADALRGMEGFSHLWLIWGFSEVPQEQSFRPTVRPPRLGGNTRVGVWATRSPYRPNPLGLSCVKIVRVETSTPDGPVITVSGADLMNGTPIYDIKPYIPYADCVNGATGGFADEFAGYRLEVVWAPGVREKALAEGRSEEWLDGLAGVLSSDPRPAYQTDPEKIYGMRYADAEVSFSAEETRLIIRDVRGA